MNPRYVIEHLEPELWDWCIIEYRHISKIVGKDNLWFTNIKKSDTDKLKGLGKVSEESIKTIQLDNVCVLDPEAPQTIVPGDANKFDYFIFGGILGDNPPRKRTWEELTPFMKTAEARNIGKSQFSTDNAVYVAKKILEGTRLENIQFQDGLEIDIDDIESTILPYKYAVVDGQPLISPELIEYIKKKDSEA